MVPEEMKGCGGKFFVLQDFNKVSKKIQMCKFPLIYFIGMKKGSCEKFHSVVTGTVNIEV